MTDNINNYDNISDKPIEEISSMYDLTDNKVHAYTKLSDKYNDIISSSYTMIVVGAVGLILLILVIRGIIPIPLNPETSWLFNSVLGSVFVIFIVAGIISFMHAKQVKIDAEKEDKLIEEINEWATGNLTIEELDKDLDLTQPVEILYFGRADKIKDLLMHEFENADEALIYEMTEQIYQKLYEGNENN